MNANEYFWLNLGYKTPNATEVDEFFAHNNCVKKYQPTYIDPNYITKASFSFLSFLNRN